MPNYSAKVLCIVYYTVLTLVQITVNVIYFQMILK